MINNVENLSISVENGKFFRKRVKREPFGESFVIQLRDFERNASGNSLDMSQVIRTNDTSIKKSDYLKKGDVLVTVKGVHKHALLLKDVPTKTVVTHHLLILRSPDTLRILPEFIEFVVNLDESQRWFDRKCGGTYNSILNKDTLLALPFPNITIEKQKKIIELANEVKEEKSLLLELINNRDMQLKAYTARLIREDR
jgi:hypothetical protein